MTATFGKDFIDKMTPASGTGKANGFTPSLGSRNAKQNNVNAKKLVGHALTSNDNQKMSNLGVHGGSLGPLTNMPGSMMGKNFPAIRTSMNQQSDELHQGKMVVNRQVRGHQ